MCHLQALSQVGRCRTFDAAGDGYGRGEGFVVAVLHPLDSLLRIPNIPFAVMCGSAINQA